MKKIVITALFALAFLLPSHAQYRFGISVDPQVSWLGSDKKAISGDGNIVGVGFGLNIEKYFEQRYAMYSGIFYESTGGVLTYKNGTFLDTKDQDNYKVDPGEKMKYRLQYFTIPVGFKIKSNEIGHNILYANVGLKTSLLYRAKGTTQSKPAGINTPELDSEVLDGEMNFINLGYQIGIGTEYNLGADMSLILGVTYNNGLTNTISSSSAHINLNNVSFKLGVMF